MSVYRKIDSCIWNDEKVRALSDDSQLVWLFVLTHPGMTCLGAMRATLDGLAAERHWKPARFRAAMDSLLASGLVEVDEAASFLAVPNFLRYNGPEGPNSVTKAWIKALGMLPECALRIRLVVRCRRHLNSLSQSFRDAIKQPIWDAFPDAMGDAIKDAKRDAMPDPSPEPSPIQKAEGRRQKHPSDAAEGRRHDGASPMGGSACLPAWLKKELAQIGIPEGSVMDRLAQELKTDGLRAALAKLKSRRSTNPAGLLVKRGAELAEEGRAQIHSDRDRAVALAPEALREAGWLSLPEELREDPEVQTVWCAWRAAEAQVDATAGGGWAESSAMARQLQDRALALLISRHPEALDIQGRVESAVNDAPVGLEARTRRGAQMVALGLQGANLRPVREA